LLLNRPNAHFSLNVSFYDQQKHRPFQQQIEIGRLTQFI